MTREKQTHTKGPSCHVCGHEPHGKRCPDIVKYGLCPCDGGTDGYTLAKEVLAYEAELGKAQSVPEYIQTVKRSMEIIVSQARKIVEGVEG